MAIKQLLGAPGLYELPDDPVRALTGVRMDVCAFVGVAPRGPVRVPVIDETWPGDRPCVEPERPRRHSVAVPVESFGEYTRLFGGFDGPGLLPYAVAAFFEQGGRRAYIVRVVHRYPIDEIDPRDVERKRVKADSATAEGTIAGVRLVARSEGSWGNRLRASLSYKTRSLPLSGATVRGEIRLRDPAVPIGSLLRLTYPSGYRELRFITALRTSDPQEGTAPELFGIYELPTSGIPSQVEVVTAALQITDGDGRTELHDEVGLSSLHPRWLATVLCYQSDLVFPAPEWRNGEIRPANAQLAVAVAKTESGDLTEVRGAGVFAGGRDRYEDIEPEDFFDPSWTLEDGGDVGVHAVSGLRDVSLLVVPDLYSPQPLDRELVQSLFPANPRPAFTACVAEPSEPNRVRSSQLERLQLDPRHGGDLRRITQLQQALVEFAEAQRQFVVLLDVPPHLPMRQVLSWRAHFSSSFAAAYHPWPLAARTDDNRSELVAINPSAVAAGIIAAQEQRFGVQQGPANTLALGVVSIQEPVSQLQHDELHQSNVNVFRMERDGVMLTAARTLDRGRDYRQLSVRRLMSMLRRVLEQQMEWLVFEPNTIGLRAEVEQSLRVYLRQLHAARAFSGVREEDAFFVRCDDELNPSYVQDTGKLIVEIGVAPAEPMEFLVLRIARSGEGSLRVTG